MMRRWRIFGRSESGAAAIELAFVLPILAALLLLGVNGWLQLSQSRDMSSALQTGARYYQEGGADDDAAKALALSAWRNPPTDASVTVSRTCTCGASAAACSDVCSDETTPKAFVTLSAQSTFKGFDKASQLSQQETVRVR